VSDILFNNIWSNAAYCLRCHLVYRYKKFINYDEETIYLTWWCF